MEEKGPFLKAGFLIHVLLKGQEATHTHTKKFFSLKLINLP